VVLNDGPIPQKVRARYSAQRAEPVGPDFVVPGARPRVVTADLLGPGPVVRHDCDKLGPLLCALAARPGREREDELPSTAADGHERARLAPVAVDLTGPNPSASILPNR
jgi:hypothetical protein